jgi:alkylation response protein AidB-like acyl-CoA dehydrogenase
MNFTFNKEQQDIRKAAREFAKGEFPDAAPDFDRNETFDLKIWKKACDLGFVGLFIEEKYEGAEYGFLEHCLVTEEFSAIEPGLGQAVLSTTLGSEILSLFGSEEQKQLVLPKLILGEAILGATIAESDGDWDVTHATTSAVKDGEEWVINGSKMFVPNGTLAKYMLVYCQTDPQAPSREKQYSFILVPADTPGYTATKIRGRLGLRASDTAEITLNHVRVPLENLLGKEGEGLKEVNAYFDRMRLSLCAQAVGLARSALKEAVEHTGGRHIFGVPLNTFQATQFKIAEMAIRTRAARNLYYEAAWSLDQGKPDSALIALAKHFCAEVAIYCADEALQMHGGYGYIDEYKVQRLYRDAKALELYEGSKEMELISGVMDLGMA